MQEIEEGEFFPISTKNRKEAVNLLLEKIKARNGQAKKGNLVHLLDREDVYRQKKDCKDFVNNVVNCENIPIESVSRYKVALGASAEVKA